MSYYAVYSTSTGVLHCDATVLPEDWETAFPAKGLAVREYPEKPAGFLWSEADRDFTTPAPPPKREPITPVEFRRRFTLQERQAIKTVRESDAIVDDFMDELVMAQSVDLDDPETLGALDYLVGIGVITSQRRGEILV
jgi:hypothetical protein